MPEPIRIHLEEVDPINVDINEPDPVNINLQDKIVVIHPEHDKLKNLDYEQAGHTGFTPGRLNLLNNIPNGTTNERLHIVANVNDVPSKIAVSDLQKRIIRTSDDVPDDLQVGQYLLLKKN